MSLAFWVAKSIECPVVGSQPGHAKREAFVEPVVKIFCSLDPAWKSVLGNHFKVGIQQ